MSVTTLREVNEQRSRGRGSATCSRRSRATPSFALSSPIRYPVRAGGIRIVSSLGRPTPRSPTRTLLLTAARAGYVIVGRSSWTGPLHCELPTPGFPASPALPSSPPLRSGEADASAAQRQVR
jgi:hypothetical protein